MEDFSKENINDSLIQSLLKYATARIDIKNAYDTDNYVEIIDNSDSSAKIQYPEWFKDENGTGMVIETNNLSMDLKFKCINDGRLYMYFRGLDINDINNNKFPIYIDYTSLIINGKEYLEENKLTWHDEPLTIERQVKNNELITIHVEWKPFNKSSIYESKLRKEIEDLNYKLDEKKEEIDLIKNKLEEEKNQIIEELKEENENLKRKISLISNSSLMEIRKIKKEL